MKKSEEIMEWSVPYYTGALEGYRKDLERLRSVGMEWQSSRLHQFEMMLADLARLVHYVDNGARDERH